MISLSQAILRIIAQVERETIERCRTAIYPNKETMSRDEYMTDLAFASNHAEIIAALPLLYEYEGSAQ